MRERRIGIATFLPLDRLRPKPTNERLRSLGPSYRLAVDITRFDDAHAKAVHFAIGNPARP